MNINDPKLINGSKKDTELAHKNESTDEAENFYQTLSLLEQTYCQRLLEVFQWVQPKKPEKGIQALILRARKKAQQEGLPLSDALDEMLAGATQRTLKRVELLQSCHLSPPSGE